jgi:hypothetical protein
MPRLWRLYALTSVIGSIVLVVPNIVALALGGGDPGLGYLAFFWVLLWLLLGTLLLTAGLLRRGLDSTRSPIR